MKYVVDLAAGELVVISDDGKDPLRMIGKALQAYTERERKFWFLTPDELYDRWLNEPEVFDHGCDAEDFDDFTRKEGFAFFPECGVYYRVSNFSAWPVPPNIQTGPVRNLHYLKRIRYKGMRP